MINKEDLKEYANEEEINAFFKVYDYNFGDGEILSDEHILNLFKRKMFHEFSYIEYYIDCFRTLQILEKDTDTLLNIELSDLVEFHNALVSEFKSKSDEILTQKYFDVIEPYNRFSFDCIDYMVEPIKTLKQLDWEGEYMNHCIATYRFIFVKGQYVGFKFFNKKSWERLTLGCRVNNGVLMFDQLKSHSNYPASKESKDMVMNYCENFGIEYSTEHSYDLI